MLPEESVWKIGGEYVAPILFPAPIFHKHPVFLFNGFNGFEFPDMPSNPVTQGICDFLIFVKPIPFLTITLTIGSLTISPHLHTHKLPISPASSMTDTTPVVSLLQ